MDGCLFVQQTVMFANELLAGNARSAGCKYNLQIVQNFVQKFSTKVTNSEIIIIVVDILNWRKFEMHTAAREEHGSRWRVYFVRKDQSSHFDRFEEWTESKC